MKKKQIVFLWIGIIIVLVVMTFFGFPYVVRIINEGKLFSGSTMMSLYLAVYTLEATLLIAVLIYSLQNNASGRENRRREENAKRIIYTELTAGLKSVVCASYLGNAIDISGHMSELFLTYLPDMQHCLDSKQLHNLIKIIDFLVNVAQLAVEDADEATAYMKRNLSCIVQPQFCAALISPFSHRFSDVDDYRRVLNQATRSVLAALSDEQLPAMGENSLQTAQGKKLLEQAEDGRVRIYDRREELLCDAVLNEDSADFRGIESGWAKCLDYEGEFLDGVRHGRGCGYSRVYHHKLFEGIWEKGEPYDGTQFDMVVEKEAGEEDYELLFPYWREWSLVSSNIFDYFCQEDITPDLSCLYVCDICGKVDSEQGEVSHIRTLLDFMEEEDPKHVDGVLEAMKHAAEFVGAPEE